MHFDWILLGLLIFLLLLVVWLMWWLVLRRADSQPFLEPLNALRGELQTSNQQLERSLRDEVARSAAGTRTELVHTLAQTLVPTLTSLQQTLLAQQSDVARTQNEQIDSFRNQLATTQQTTQQQQADTLSRASEHQATALQRFSETLTHQLHTLSVTNDQRMAEVRATVEQKLTTIQLDNEKKLEQIRATVDEKLHATLEQRLGASFKQVADRLEQVHRGLGEMQLLAKDVGSLNRVLNNVKTRGLFGEIQLAGLLEQVFAPEQYAVNVEVVPNSGARVEFAVKLPGRRDDGLPLWLPIDAKFPREDYERLLDAQDRADKPEAEAAAKALEQRLRLEAKTIREKYVAPPHTTEFAILFVPTEGLYAEALRRPGLMEALQREHRVTLVGPTTLLATLSSLQMGFRTLALEKRSAEVWEVLGAVKTEFGKFGEVLAKTKKKLDEASSHIDLAQTRTNVMARKLKSVETLPDTRTQTMLPAVPLGVEAALDDSI
jgi:DNA recombination protein RmuC